MAKQQQFLNVVDRDEAERRFYSAISLDPLGTESIPLERSLGRILAEDIIAKVDVPSFDRSNYDGFAVRASETVGASEERPVSLQLQETEISAGVVPDMTVSAGTAITIATGGMLPRGANAVVMIEDTEIADDQSLLVRRAIAAGFGVSFAGTDIGAGEILLHRGDLLTSRETGSLAAIGCSQVPVWRQPRVGIISSGDEIIEPGKPMRAGLVYDSNARILADAVREAGGLPESLGIVSDNLNLLRDALAKGLESCDILLLSGGTSKGGGDVSYRAVGELEDPGIVVHGVALKPGKPICLAASQNKPVVILPGFPTSAIFTFHEFVVPVIQQLAGYQKKKPRSLQARLSVKINSSTGRTEYALVNLVERPGSAAGDGQEMEYAAFPMGKGSGSVTTFSRADGFITIGRHEEMVEAGSPVRVQLIGQDLSPADLVVIGSHCIGLDYLMSQLQDRGYRTKLLTVGSSGGLEAAARGECDLAGIHLYDPETDQYNRPFLTDSTRLIPGYQRRQGLLFRRGDQRFENKSVEDFIQQAITDDDCVMVNRNQGSGTRILIDRLLQSAQPAGYAVQARNHNAVAAAIVQQRADWGMAIEHVVDPELLGFLPVCQEQFDFVVNLERQQRQAVQAFCQLLADKQICAHLHSLGLVVG
ncbi:MAG TPA: molybdopterin biosynthesis protein [Planctomycetaceae bacterium]|nr:molybdopterin biosynthesis protein [Planctomycetaceae bacterium]